MSNNVVDGLRTLSVRELAKAIGIQSWRVYEMITDGTAPPFIRAAKKAKAKATVRSEKTRVLDSNVVRESHQTPGRKAFSWKRQERLERLLAGEDVGLHRAQEASPQTTQEMWRAIGGGGDDGGRPARRPGGDGGSAISGESGGSRSSGRPFERGNDSRGPFNRR